MTDYFSDVEDAASSILSASSEAEIDAAMRAMRKALDRCQMPVSGLTKRQSEAYDFISGYCSRHGHSPSYTEIADALGLAGRSAISRLVDGLEQRGWITKISHAPRSIIIVHEARS